MPFTLYNTLTRSESVFKSLTPGKAGFYGCGPTVYNYAHIGNLRAYVTHDVLVRALRRRGYDVTHVMNITDVGHLSGDNDEGDDKMLKSAAERGKSVLEVAAFYTRAFFNDTDRLNIIRPNVVCRATEHIEDMIALIKRIEAAGCVYSAGGNLYFDISKFPYYGELARLKLDELKAGARTGLDGNKRNPQDFVLWFTKSKFEDQALLWDSPWGRGYPGWHIECSAMSIKYLGEQFDIHAGGIDHIQIHHTNEIAQSESATGRHPWVQFWLHNEFLVLDRGKMSKSAGGFITLQNLVDSGFAPLDYRYFLLGAHYRSQLQFSNENLSGARNSRKSLVQALQRVAGNAAASEAPPPAGSKVFEYIDAFDAALDSDLSTPRALAVLWGLVKDQTVKPEDMLWAVFQMDTVFGLSLREALAQAGEGAAFSDAAEIEAAVEERAQAKKARDFAKADSIRAALKDRGIILEDTPKGTVWRVLNNV
ncbi:MAG: cysteine--tRNA ligase [Spirochaetaceae bacterium]|jgi:cysteinyl-tRNA synthetase|nr:cysteine--tRNA ligase [Spirochaetaceae bacterium]